MDTTCRSCNVVLVPRVFLGAGRKPEYCSKKCSQRQRHLKHRYGISTQEWDSRFKSQNHKCASCGVTKSEKQFCVDHDHASGEVRGILCSPCNLAVGSSQEDPQRLRLCANYLERSVSRRGTALEEV